MAWQKKIGIFPWHPSQQMLLLESGLPFFHTLLKNIHAAKNSIHFQVYIFEPDETGKVVFEALLNAANRGVKVYIRLDAYGSSNFPKSWQNQLKRAGVNFDFFSKFKFAFTYHIGVRLHHKLFIFDEQLAMLGGINISNHYSHLGGQHHWLDYGIQITGPVVKDLSQICLGIMKRTFRFRPYQKIGDKNENYPSAEKQIRVLQNYWLKAKFGISKQYRQKIRTAKEEIILVSSYFLPSPALKRLLKKAAKRGVRVELILGGKSDVKLVQFATQFFYKDLLDAGVIIKEWHASVLHAKIAIADKNWMCIGSYNLNHLSDFGSVECNIELQDETFLRTANKQIGDKINQHCITVEPTNYFGKTHLFIQLRNRLAYQLVSIGMKILFYLQKKP